MSANSTLNLRRVGHEIPQCQHIRLCGLRCGSPALRGQNHCYYHSVIRQERPTATIPQLDDGLNIQFSLREIVQGVAVGKWDTKRASLLLYAMQIAASNLRAARADLNLAHFDAITEMPKPKPAYRSRTTQKKESVEPGSPARARGAQCAARDEAARDGVVNVTPRSARQAEPNVGSKKPAAQAPAPPSPKNEQTKQEPTLEAALLTLQAAALKSPTIPIASEIATNGNAHKSSA